MQAVGENSAQMTAMTEQMNDLQTDVTTLIDEVTPIKEVLKEQL